MSQFGFFFLTWPVMYENVPDKEKVHMWWKLCSRYMSRLCLFSWSLFLLFMNVYENFVILIYWFVNRKGDKYLLAPWLVHQKPKYDTVKHKKLANLATVENLLNSNAPNKYLVPIASFQKLFKFKKCNLTLAVSPPCEMHMPHALS